MKFTSTYEPGEFEADIYLEWEKSGAFKPRILQPDGVEEDTSGTYSIVMPPPNANGNLHIGHGLTIAVEDSLTRYYRLRGKSTWYVPGADHAGFETWVVYERALEKVGHTRFEYSRDELYAQVWDFVQEQRGNMELQVRALGASCSWEDLTFTLDENVVRRVYKTFEKMFNDGMVYRGEKLVNYCPKHQTAFADIEVEQVEEEGKLYDIKYSEEITVSTTRPETLFGDTAVAVNPEDERYKDLIGKTVRLPLSGREILIVADEHADPEYGTGAVKITPAHDFDDFEVGERHELERIRVIDDEGKLFGEAVPEEFRGLSVEEGRKAVLEALEAEGVLVGEKKITHIVPHCYKCGAVIEPTLKEQWFIDTEKLAKEAIKHLENDEIKFHPANKKKVLIDYLKGLKDWNISRQIPWGIAIPMFRKVEFAEDYPDWIFDTRVDLKEIEYGGVRYVRDEDTFDTWFSSSHWPIVCTDWEEGRENPYYPLNVMETGADILFAWVARMIMMGVYVTGEVPFREVYLHGLVLDAKGKKMSKSKGNVINPMELVAKYGSDAFRLGILRGRSAGLNQAFSEESVKSGRNLCNKLWNISRFVNEIVATDSSNYSSRDVLVSPSSESQHSVSLAQCASGNTGHRLRSQVSVDNSDSGKLRDVSSKSNLNFSSYTTLNMGEDWIVRELEEARKKVERGMRDYRFSEVVEELYLVIWDKYADWFLESQKIYKNASLLRVTLENILKMLHPFAPFVTEAIWQSLSWTEGLLIEQEWPKKLEYDPISAENFERLIPVVTETRRVVAGLKNSSKEAKKMAEKEGFGLLYGDDSLVDDNSLLVMKLARVKSISSIEGQPKGIRLAIPNHEVYLDVPASVVKEYKDGLEERILAVGRELDALEARMRNPNYVTKAPAQLVKETEDGIQEKKELIERLRKEIEVIE